MPNQCCFNSCLLAPGYMLFMSSGFYSLGHLARGLMSLKLYFALRAAVPWCQSQGPRKHLETFVASQVIPGHTSVSPEAILLSLSMACICPPLLAAARQRWSNGTISRRCWSIHVASQAGHFLTLDATGCKVLGLLIVSICWHVLCYRLHNGIAFMNATVP